MIEIVIFSAGSRQKKPASRSGQQPGNKKNNEAEKVGSKNTQVLFSVIQILKCDLRLLVDIIDHIPVHTGRFLPWVDPHHQQFRQLQTVQPEPRDHGKDRIKSRTEQEKRAFKRTSCSGGEEKIHEKQNEERKNKTSERHIYQRTDHIRLENISDLFHVIPPSVSIIC